MNRVKTTKNSPEKVSLEKDKKYFWCTCGLSGNQPFCDGAHKASNEFKPHHFEVEETKESVSYTHLTLPTNREV